MSGFSKISISQTFQKAYYKNVKSDPTHFSFWQASSPDELNYSSFAVETIEGVS